MVGIRFEGLKEKYKILVMAVLLGICCFLAFYLHTVLGIEVVYGHFFYVPIILAALWWRRKGFVVAIFLALLLLLTHPLRYGFYIGGGIDDLVRASFFYNSCVYYRACQRERSKKERGDSKRKERVAGNTQSYQ